MRYGYFAIALVLILNSSPTVAFETKDLERHDRGLRIELDLYRVSDNGTNISCNSAVAFSVAIFELIGREGEKPVGTPLEQRNSPPTAITNVTKEAHG